jgi:hypothetical protein
MVFSAEIPAHAQVSDSNEVSFLCGGHRDGGPFREQLVQQGRLVIRKVLGQIHFLQS